MRYFFFGLLLAAATTAAASMVDTVVIHSASMNQSRKCVVITPFVSQQKPIPVPVVYLLHGYSGSYSNWLKRVPLLRAYAEQYQVIIVCPDGDFDSWYLDCPADNSTKYETYIAQEVPAFIDSNYLTIKSRYARAIAGLSMGGHGALFIALRHSGTFGACGSMSGVMDLSVIGKRDNLLKCLGDSLSHPQRWKDYSILYAIGKKPKDSLAMIIDCGVDDVFIGSNRNLHQKMVDLKIEHDYSERPGGHDWSYWRNAVEYQLLFFRRYFDAMREKKKY